MAIELRDYQQNTPARVVERFLSHVEVLEDGCWRWIGAIQSGGYGCFWANSSGSMQAHRWAYEYFIGPIPKGLHLDHLCRNRWCVCPQHLQPVTQRENSQRGLLGILRPDKKSRYVGAHWHERANKWQAKIQIKEKCYHLGLFTSQEEAHQAYARAVFAYENDGTLPTSLAIAKKTSKYKGVCWDRHSNKWVARRCIKKTKFFLGLFDSEEEAYQAYLNAASKLEEGKECQ